MGSPAKRSRWHLVQTRARQESLAERNLRRQGYDVFLPTELRTVRHARRYREVRSAFFPGYLFVSFDPRNQRWRPINSTLGVSRLVSFNGGAPAGLPTALVETFKARCDANGDVVAASTFCEGETIRVRHGPFAGLVGRVVETPREGRLSVLLGFLNSERAVELDAHVCETAFVRARPAGSARGSEANAR